MIMGRHGNLRGRRHGFTLVEVMVSITILIIFMAMYTTTSLAIMTATSGTADMANANSDRNTAMDTLSVSFGNASEVNDAGTDSQGNQYVEAYVPEYASTMHGSDGNRVDECVQAKYSISDNAIMTRTWSPTLITNSSSLPSWKRITSKTVANTDDIFDVSTFNNRRYIRFQWTEGKNSAQGYGERMVMALNSHNGAPATPVCMMGSASRS